MKTYRIVILGLLVILSGVSFGATINLIPEYNRFESRNDHTNIITNLPFIDFNGFVAVKKHSIVAVKSLDTVFIDFADVLINGDFPHSSINCIKKQIPYPAFAKEQGLEGGAMVCFTFNDKGKIIINEVSASDQLFESFVVQKLLNIHLNNCEVEPGRDYFLRVLFKRI